MRRDVGVGGRYFWTVQLYSVDFFWFFFVRHTQVYVCTLWTCCSSFFIHVLFPFWEEKGIHCIKQKNTWKKPPCAVWPVCPYCYSSLRGHSFLVSQLHSLTGPVSRTVFVHHTSFKSTKRFWQCKKKKKRSAFVSFLPRFWNHFEIDWLPLFHQFDT